MPPSPYERRWEHFKRITCLHDKVRPIIEPLFSAYIRAKAAERVATRSASASKLLRKFLVHIEEARSTYEEILLTEDASAAFYEAESEGRHGRGLRTDESLDELSARGRKAKSVCRTTRPGPKCEAEYALIHAILPIVELSVGRTVRRSDAAVEMFVEIFGLLGQNVRSGTIHEALRVRDLSNEITA